MTHISNKQRQRKFNKGQLLYKEMFVGTLIYILVLGFFNDYSSFVYAKSFSTILLASIILQALTLLVFLIKKKIIHRFREKDGTAYRFLMFFNVWLVMFFSKFIFIWAIDFLFRENMNINGFFSIFFVVVAVTSIHKLADYIFLKLGD